MRLLRGPDPVLLLAIGRGPGEDELLVDLAEEERLRERRDAILRLLIPRNRLPNRHQGVSLPRRHGAKAQAEKRALQIASRVAEQPEDLPDSIPLMRPEREGDPEREDHELESRQRHQGESAGRDRERQGEPADRVRGVGRVQTAARFLAEPDAAGQEAEHRDVTDIDHLRGDAMGIGRGRAGDARDEQLRQAADRTPQTQRQAAERHEAAMPGGLCEKKEVGSPVETPR